MMYTFNLQGLLTSWFLCGAILMAVINSAYAIEQYPANPSVKIFTVAKRDIPEWSEYHGVVGSRNYVDVIGQVMGRIKAVHVQVGQVVKKGELLIELDGPGGVILVHDYNYRWPGVVKAVDDFVQTIPENMVLLPDINGTAMIIRNK